MNKIIILAVASLMLISCGSESEKTKDANLAIAKKYINAVETGNVTAMDSLLADNYMGYGPSVDDSINKVGALASWKYNVDNLYESIKYTRFQNIAVTVGKGEQADPGDWVSNYAYLTIKYKDGRGPVNAWVNAIYKIENGKIARSRTFYNEADVLRQLGYSFVQSDKNQ
jgi:ketosteroid isomerase-like protein